MGLSSDLEQVFLDNLSDAGTESIEVDAKQKVKIKELSAGISNAIINFLTKQNKGINNARIFNAFLDNTRNNSIIYSFF